MISQFTARFSLALVFVLGVSAGTAAQHAPVASASPVALSSAPATDSDLRSEVEHLARLVREQQKRIEALEAERGTVSRPPGESALVPPVAAPGTTAGPSTETVSPASSTPSVTASQEFQNAGSSDERIRNLERQIKGLGRLSLSGDIRLRGEPIFGGPTDQSLDRARERIRARFNVVADMGSQFRAGFSLATGDINDPTTTNQTNGVFYTRKAFALDQAFAEYRPKQFKALTLIGGKFRYPWFNTELTWDKDLNPEGVAETLAFDLNNSALKRIAVVAFQLPFAEVAGTSATDKRISQQITYGGQLQTNWQLLPRVKFSAYNGFYWYDGSDSIALALARASSKNPQTPFTGLAPLGTGNAVQNSIYTTTAANVVTIDGNTHPTGVTSVYNSQYGSQFALFDNLARFDIDTGNPRLPITLIGDYVQNTEACANLANIASAPANTSTQVYVQTRNAACVSNQRRGYWAEMRVGRLQQKSDWQIGYTRIYIEREAVLGNFNYSDIRQGTNVTQHRVDAFYQVAPSVQLGFTALIGRPLASPEPWLTRLQFDAVYIF